MLSILHRYLLRQFLFYLASSLGSLLFLFLTFDFFDRIDNVIAEKPSFWTIIQYFSLKIPGTFVLVFPMAMLAATLFTVGLLSRNSELTAMRASGQTVLWLTRPILLSAIVGSLFILGLNETIVPLANKRVREIYDIEIKKKDASGWYSQDDIWWREKHGFVGVHSFNSRTNSIDGLTVLSITPDFTVSKRVEAVSAQYLDPTLGWSMDKVTQYQFLPGKEVDVSTLKSLPLPIKKQPEDLYNVETDTGTMTYRELRSFIKTLARNGLRFSQHLTDLYDKIAYSFSSFFVALVVIPFALQPARSGSMARSVVASLTIAFLYFALHSLTIAMGRAGILTPAVASWAANGVLLLLGVILLSGAESPA